MYFLKRVFKKFLYFVFGFIIVIFFCLKFGNNFVILLIIKGFVKYAFFFMCLELDIFVKFIKFVFVILF